MKIKIFVILLSLVFLKTNDINASGAAFLDEELSARPIAMGSAFAGVSDDINAIYSNPASLDFMALPEFTATYKKGFIDSYHALFGYIQPLRNFGTISSSIMMFDAGNMDIDYLDGTSETVSMEKDFVVTLGYGKGFLEKIFLGMNLKYINSALAGKYSASAFAVDIALIYKLIDNKFSAGVVLRNFGTGLKYISSIDYLPTELRLGGTYKIDINDANSHSLLLAADLVRRFNDDSETLRLNLGLEMGIWESIALRAGYKIGNNSESFTAGIGLNVESIDIGYAFVPSAIEITHRITLSYKLGLSDKFAVADKYEEKEMFERALCIRYPECYKPMAEDTESITDRFLPVISSLEPKKIKPGSEIEIHGKLFASRQNMRVKVSNEMAEIIFTDPKKIRIKVPANLKPGSADIVVMTNKGSSSPASLLILPLKSPMLSALISFSDEQKDNILTAEESGNITVLIKNAKGAGEAFNVIVKPVCSNQETDIIIPVSVKAGDIADGSQKEIVIPVKGGIGLKDGKAVIDISFDEANGFTPDPISVTFNTNKLNLPDILMAKMEIDDGIYPDNPDKLAVGNNNGIVEPGETVEVSAVILNNGTGICKGCIVDILCDNPQITLLTQTEKADLGDIEPGKWKELKFAFRVEKRYTDDKTLPIRLKIYEKRKIFEKDIPLNIAIGRVYPRTHDVVIDGKPIDPFPFAVTALGDELEKIPEYISEKNPNAYAVVVGIEKYRDITSAEFASRDAQSVRDYLINAVGINEENITYAINERASKNDLNKYFNWLKNNADKDSLIIVYYSGHGAPDPADGEAYLVPYDGDPNTIKQSGYSLRHLYEQLNKLPANKVLVIIDACFSGVGGPRTVIAKGARPLVVTPAIDTGNVVVMSASTSSQICWFYEEKQHGLFTYFFLKGLQGEADSNKDKKILLTELYEYLKPQVIKIAKRNNREQEPQLSQPGEKAKNWQKMPLAILK